MFYKRVVQQPLMQAFDGPDAQASCGRRENTTVAPQALALLNDPFVRARAMDFAQRIERESGAGIEAQVRWAWNLALGREPSADDVGSCIAFINGQIHQRAMREPAIPQTDAQQLAMADFCQSIFAMNEFIYVD